MLLTQNLLSLKVCWSSSISSFEIGAPAPTPISRVSMFKLLIFFATVSTSTNIVGVPYMIVHLHTKNEVTSFMPHKAITHKYFSLIQHIHINVLAALRVTYTSVLNCYMTLLTYTMQQILLDSWTGFQLVKKFPTLFGNWRFITMFARAHHLSLPWARSMLTWYNYMIFTTKQAVLWILMNMK